MQREGVGNFMRHWQTQKAEEKGSECLFCATSVAVIEVLISQSVLPFSRTPHALKFG